MSKAARTISAAIAAASTSSQRSQGHPLVTISLFCGVGLLVSLVAIHMGLELY
jgi:uncharacterized transporter YbjL